MENIVFYSWQSDLPSKINRSFIENCLKKAIKSLKDDSEISVFPRIDKDTAGVKGAPSIVDSIFFKIAKSEVFVADVSCINGDSSGKKTPNPNVLVELGYAVAKLGWERIVLVCNTEYGEIKDLPFDIRSRRVIQYNLSESGFDEEKTTSSKKLISAFANQIKASINSSYSSTSLSANSSQYWVGRWANHDHSSTSINLTIAESSSLGFLFSLKVNINGHSGEVEGYADFLSPSHAIARIKSHESICEISFKREITQEHTTIEIRELGGCISHHGMRAHFDGLVIRSKSRFEIVSNAHEIVVQRLIKLLGKDYLDFEHCMSSVGQLENLDSMLCSCFFGEIGGARQEASAAIMIGNEAQVWVAFTKDGVIKYYTTESEYSNNMPKTLDEWKKDFPVKTMYCSYFDPNFDSPQQKNVIQDVGISLLYLRMAMEVLNGMMPGEQTDPNFRRVLNKMKSNLLIAFQELESDDTLEVDNFSGNGTKYDNSK